MVNRNFRAKVSGQNQFLDSAVSARVGRGRSSRLDLEHVHKGARLHRAIYLPGIVQNIDRCRGYRLDRTPDSVLGSGDDVYQAGPISSGQRVGLIDMNCGIFEAMAAEPSSGVRATGFGRRGGHNYIERKRSLLF